MATTHQDTNVNQLVINKMTKQEYDNLLQVSETELYLVEEQVDSTVTQGSTNPVQSGAVYSALQNIGVDAVEKHDLTSFIPSNVGDAYMHNGTSGNIFKKNHFYALSEIVQDDFIKSTQTHNLYEYDSDTIFKEIPPFTVYSCFESGGVSLYYYNLSRNGVDYILYTISHYDSDYGCLLSLGNVQRQRFVNFSYANNVMTIGNDTYTSSERLSTSVIEFEYENYIGISHDFTLYGFLGRESYKNEIWVFLKIRLEGHTTGVPFYIGSGVQRVDDGDTVSPSNYAYIWNEVVPSVSYNDLNDKPLSVESSKVKYTLSDGTTKLTLAQESTVKDIPINFTDTLTNITLPFASGDDIITIVTKTWNIVKRLMQGYLCKDGNLQGGKLFMNFISYRDTQYTYNQKELICKYWLSQVKARITEIGCYDCYVAGILEMANKWYLQGSVDNNNIDQFCSFVAMNTVHSGSSNIPIIYFGYRNGTWNYFEKTI